MTKPCKATYTDYPTELNLSVPVKSEAEGTQVIQLVDNREEIIGALEALLAYEDDRPGEGTFGAEVYVRAEAALKLVKGE